MRLFALAFGVALMSAGCASLQTRVEIDAPAREVSRVLYTFDQYPRWNPFIVKVDGKVTAGSTVRVTVKPDGKSTVTGDTKVLVREPQRLVWRGSLPGLFTGVHEFRIEAVGARRSIFHNEEKMSGLVVPLLNLKTTQAGFDAMNVSLKREAERR